MTIDCTVDACREIVTFTSGRSPSLLDVAAAFQGIWSTPDLAATRLFVLDSRQAAFAPSMEFVKGMVMLVRGQPLRNNARWALLLAPDQPAAYGMGRMMQALLDVDGIRCAVFAHASGQEAEAEALAWLLADAPASAPRPS